MSEAVPAPNGAAPAADPDAARYAELAKELDGLNGAEPQPEPQAQPEPQPQPEPEQKPKPTYEDLERNYGNVQEALRQERSAKKASEEQLGRFMRIVEDARARRDQPEAKKDEAPKLPEVQEDPIGHFTGRIAQLEAQLTEARKGVQTTTEEQRAYQQQQMIHSEAVRSEQDIRNPKSQSHKADYDQAIEHLEGLRIRQIDALYGPDDAPGAEQWAQSQGYRSMQEMKVAAIVHDRQAITVQALQRGIPPAQFYYQMAQASGWQTPAPKPNGSLADQAKQQLEASKRGINASVSISGSNSGRKGADDMALSDLADLAIEDPETFDKMWDKMAKAGRLG